MKHMTVAAMVLRHQPFVLVVTIATVCLNVFLFIIVPKGFFPQQDTGIINGTIQGPQDISFAAMKQKELMYARLSGRIPPSSTQI